MIVPCFNEAERFPLNYWVEVIRNTNFHWIFVNDGSKDGTSDILQKLKAPNVEVLTLEENRGKSEAIRRGALDALNNFKKDTLIIGYIDADGAFSVEDIKSLEEKASKGEKSQMIWSSRVALSGNDIQRSLKRHYLGRVISTLIWRGEKSAIYDTQSGLKFLPINAEVKGIFNEPFSTRWFVDLEIYIRWCGAFNTRPAVIEVPLTFWREKPGSKVKSSQVLSILKEVHYIRRELQKVGR
jgi:dolichyl-phosphate beta-glucosyltransferase